MIEGMSKGENIDHHIAGGVTFRGVTVGGMPVFQICSTPEGGRVGVGEYLNEPPAVAAQWKDVLKGALAKLKE
jgi:hypothetical protein